MWNSPNSLPFVNIFCIYVIWSVVLRVVFSVRNGEILVNLSQVIKTVIDELV